MIKETVIRARFIAAQEATQMASIVCNKILLKPKIL